MMKTQILKLPIIILSSIFLLSSPALAGGKAKGKNKTQPPGWDQGDKAGWNGEDKPPGLTDEKLEKKQKAGMKGEKAKAKAQKEGKKVKSEAEEEKAEQEAEIEKQKKERETEINQEKEKIKSNTKKKEG
jgi:hypothetical protein